MDKPNCIACETLLSNPDNTAKQCVECEHHREHTQVINGAVICRRCYNEQM